MVQISRQASSPILRPLSVLALLIGLAAALDAHAVLIKSTPKANGDVKGPSIKVSLVFNSRIDQGRSVLTLDGPGHTASPLAVKKDPSTPQTLTSSVSDAKPGMYVLHWQVLSVDGHITQGQIGFHVE